jgi:hypothetical protein
MWRRVLVRTALAAVITAGLALLPASTALGWGGCYWNQCPAPGISLLKLQRDGASGAYTHDQFTGTAGDRIDYEMLVTNTGNTPLAITFSDPGCDAGTLSAPSVISGSYNAGSLSAGGELQYTCSHVLTAANAPQLTNTAAVTGQAPGGASVSATCSVVTVVNVPAISVVKLQREGTSGAFTSSPIYALVGTPIQYEIQVTNTGNLPLALSFSDPLCDAGTLEGPTSLSGTLSVNVLSPGGAAQYTCSHVLTSGDASPFTNVATVTGTPPSGTPVTAGSSVTANKQSVSSVTVQSVKGCGKGKVRKTKKVHGKKVTVCAAKAHVTVKSKKISRKPTKSSGVTV